MGNEATVPDLPPTVTVQAAPKRKQVFEDALPLNPIPEEMADEAFPVDGGWGHSTRRGLLKSMDGSKLTEQVISPDGEYLRLALE